jgi:preprotein translocase subunit SecE
VANRNRGRAADDDSVDEPIEDAYDDADLDDADADDEPIDDLAEDADDVDEEPAPRGRSRAGAATRERTVSRDRTKVGDARTGPFGRLARRFRETVAELQKVIWPTRKELLTYTTVVVIFVSIVTAFVSGLDVAFGRLMFVIFGGD